MVERGSAKHSPRIDEDLDRSTQSMTRGSPVEARAEESREQEGPADGEPTPDARLLGGGSVNGLSLDSIEARTDLARHLEGSVFPASPDEIIASATRMHAPPALLDALQRLPDRTYSHVGAVWEALGGAVEHRDTVPETPAKPRRRPRRTKTTAATEITESGPQVFEFEWDLRFRVPAGALGITPANSGVEIEHGRLVARFGRWRLETPLENVAGATRTGPYAWWKVIGGPRLSLADRGLTLATNASEGVCITFDTPVPAIDPLGLVKHPGLTVTVREPERLAAALSP